MRGGDQALWLYLSAWNADCQTTMAALLSLGLAAADIVHSCRNAHCISLLLPAEGSTSHLIPPLSRLSLAVSSRRQGCIHDSFKLFLLLASQAYL